jgi:DNA repair exonuclease SbcCD nuclease subunit
MRVAIITDTHYGCRKGSKLFQDYFEAFYKNIFFPTLEKENITTVLHLGDAFDSRKSIDYQSLEWTKRVVLDPLLKYDVHMLVGNHDAYYKNTNSINSPSLLLQNYSNIKTYSDPEIVKLGNLNVLFIPWICVNNEERTLRLIKTGGCKVAMGHLELNGFQAHHGHIMDDGMDSVVFDGFTKVFLDIITLDPIMKLSIIWGIHTKCFGMMQMILVVSYFRHRNFGACPSK